MILYIASFIIIGFVSFSLFFRNTCPLWIKILGIILIILAGLKYVVYQWIGGAFFAPQLPRFFLIFYEAYYGSLIILFFLLFLWDLYVAGNWLLAYSVIILPKRLPTSLIRDCLAGVAVILGIWGTYEAVAVPYPHTVNVKIANLPEKLDGFSIVQLSDLHIGPILKRDWLAEVVAKANRLEPDLILLTGDYIDGYADQIGSELEPLAELKAKYGVFAVTGNHEYYWRMPEWRAVLQNLNLDLLENEHRQLSINGETLVIAGIPDLVAAKFGYERPDIDKALANAPEAVRILLAHHPGSAIGYRSKIDLILSGHTHGGLMFFLQPLVAGFNGGFVNGLYPGHRGNVYVSPGTGLWGGFSCRIGVPSEITKIVLNR